ncbi:MAG TPA: DUF3098 domain-containing protein [Cytophagaceae bacterium]
MNKKLVFQKINYILMLIGLACLILGYIIMAMEDAEYGFGTLGLTVGPIILIIGFIIEFFAILYRPKEENK